MDQPKSRGKHRIRAENEIIRRRERETRYNELWNGTVKYFDHWSKSNTKFDEWTSPRYYTENNKLLNDIKLKREKEENLEKRRDKLRKLFEEERQSYEIELMVHRNRRIIDKPQRSTLDIPTNVLKEVNDNLKFEEETKRKREAEIKLFNQWRRSNPIVRQYEAKYKTKDLKLSWLDQQVEKRMQKEMEEEENKRILKENERKLKIQKEQEERYKKQLEEKKHEYKETLDKQIEELKEKKKIYDDLKFKESYEINQKNMLEELEERNRLEEKRRRDKEYALYNIRQYNRKLKQKCIDIQENLKQERLFVLKLKELELENIMEEEDKKIEIKQGIKEFLELLKQQQALEVQRQKRLEFLFDSEAKAMYDMQAKLWKQEETAREKLLADVLHCVKTQINHKLKSYQEQQKQKLLECEEMTQKIEEYYKELNKIKDEEERKKFESKQSREEELQVKIAQKSQHESLRMKELDDELERIRKEEERLQQEIIRIQQKHGPFRPPNRKFLL